MATELFADPFHSQEPVFNPSFTDIGIKSATEDFQRQIITEALNHHNGNWSAAARQLKTDRANLNRMAKRLGISIIKTIQN
jgi:anaerobic nitric oxide reductase transcription regulator